MATTPVTPAPSSAPLSPSPSVYSQVASLTSGVVDSLASKATDTTDTLTSQSVEDETETTTPPTGETPKPEASVGAADTTSQTGTEINPYDTDDSDIPQASLDVILQAPRGKEIYQGYKALQELAKPLTIGANGQTEGGIGHIPTVDQARNYFLAYKDRVMMDGDLNSGNPQQIGRFLNHVFDPNRGPQNTSIASSIAPVLAAQPELYAAAMEPFLDHYREAIMERFKEAKTEEMKDALWYAATILNKDLKGEYLKPPQEGGAAQTQADPLAEERAQLAAERADLNRVRSQSGMAQRQAWNGAYNREVADSLVAELDKALEPLKKMHEGVPRVYQAVRKQFHDDIVSAVQRNTHAMDLFGVSADAAMRAGSLQSAQELAKAYLGMALPVIRRERAKFLTEAGVVAQRQNEARHTELATIDANRTVGNGSGGAAAPVVNGTPLKKEPNELHSDYVNRMVKAATAGVARNLMR